MIIGTHAARYMKHLGPMGYISAAISDRYLLLPFLFNAPDVHSWLEQHVAWNLGYFDTSSGDVASQQQSQAHSSTYIRYIQLPISCMIHIQYAFESIEGLRVLRRHQRL